MEREPAAEALSAAVLAEALQDVLDGASDGPPCDPDSLEVSSALERLQLVSSSSSSSEAATSGTQSQAPAAGTASRSAAAASAPAGQQGRLDERPAPSAAAFAGAPAGPLGVAAADLLVEALPPEAARRRALAAAAPALEAELVRRCRLVAAAAGYSTETDDFSGLPDHILQLLDARSQASQAEAWRKAAAQAQQATALLAEAGELLARLIRRHKLEGQREADEAAAAMLRCECGWLAEKLKAVQLQLQAATYTPEAVAALRQVAAEVGHALGQATAELQQARLQLAAYRAMGPSYARLAAEHAAVLEALEEAGYELAEVEQFRALAAVTG